MDWNGIEEMLLDLVNTVWGWFNWFLAALGNLFNALFSFLPPHLRTGFGVLALIIIGVIIFFLWRRD